MKRSLFYIQIVFFILFLGRTEAAFDFLFLKDLSPSSTLDDLCTSTTERLNKVILLPSEDFDEQEAAKMIKRIAKLPPSLLEKIGNHNIKIYLFSGLLTDFPSTKHLRGKTPRGYTNPIPWDDVPGIGGGKIVLAKIGSSNPGSGHSSVNLELHELAHSIDQIVYDGIREDSKFLQIWQEEVSFLFQGNGYFLTYPEEYFAETFAMFYTDRNTKKLLKEKAPKTYAFLAKIH